MAKDKPKVKMGMLRVATPAEAKAMRQRASSNKARARRVTEVSRSNVSTKTRTKRPGTVLDALTVREIKTPKRGKRTTRPISAWERQAYNRRTVSRILPKSEATKAAERAQRAKARKRVTKIKYGKR